MSNLIMLGIRRGNQFSPNHIGNDGAIFDLTVTCLNEKGIKVNICSEDEFLKMHTVDNSLIFTMAREKRVIEKLKKMEKKKKVVINSGYGIENCFRTNMTNQLINNLIPYPKSNIVLTEHVDINAFSNLPGKGFWIKRGDFHAIHKEDVTFVESEEEGRYILKEFNLRGIPDAVISQNLRGDLVKFYGVRGTEFFYFFYPYTHNHHKYSEYESINTKTAYSHFDENLLKSEANRAASALNIYIYGGDAIIAENGSFHIIDFNDWPSFAPCREAAAPYIAECLSRHIKLNQ